MERALLLNPPGRRPYIRDYYCSKVSKSGYLFPPVDLLMVSGRLAQGHEVHALDCIADRVGPDEARRRVDALAPAVIVGLIGAASLGEDTAFYAGLRAPGRRILVSGDAALEDPAGWLAANPFADAVIRDFTSGDLVDWLAGAPGPFAGIVPRGAGNEAPPGAPGRDVSVPLPRHELFSSPRYRFPFVRRREFAVVLTDYGCPFRCTFCVMATLGYRRRPVPEVLEELAHVRRLGRREVFFIDQTFGFDEARLRGLCAGMAGLGLGWVCYARVDRVSDAGLAAMRAAGCHTVIFGVESASEEILRRYEKGYTKAQIREAFALCRRHGIRTVATFIIGLPEETEETARETLAFLKELDCDFASFNVAVPRANTGLRRDAIRDGVIPADLASMDQSGTVIALPTRALTRERVAGLRREAVRGFYLRPAYLWRRLRGIGSWYELREQAAEGLSLLRGI